MNELPVEESLLFALKFEERKLRLLMIRFFPEEGKKLKVCLNCNKAGIMGYAYLDAMTVSLNPAYFFLYGVDEAIDTLRHEVAHLLSFLDAGDIYITRRGKEVHWPHNKNWKAWCRFLGCRPVAKEKKNFNQGCISGTYSPKWQ